MASLPIALQLYSVRDQLEIDFYGTLKQVKEMGYDGVELFGLNGRTAQEWKSALAELGLKVNSSHVSVNELCTDTPKTMAAYKELGCDYVAIPWMSHGANNEKLKENLKTIETLAVAAKEAGMTLLYHNHDFEFKTVDGKPALDIIYETIPADLLKTEIDTCWVKFAGTEPAAYVRKYAGRSPLVHLKDFWKEEGDNEVPYELIGQDSSEKKKSTFEFRPIGYGLQDVASLLEASKDAGADWVIVEQDESVGRSSLEAVKMSIDYLRSLNW